MSISRNFWFSRRARLPFGQATAARSAELAWSGLGAALRRRPASRASGNAAAHGSILGGADPRRRGNPAARHHAAGNFAAGEKSRACAGKQRGFGARRPRIAPMNPAALATLTAPLKGTEMATVTEIF